VGTCLTRARVFGDVDNAGSEAAKRLASAGHVLLEYPGSPTQPLMFYMKTTAPDNWPHKPEAPASMRFLTAWAAPAIHALAGFAGLGLMAVLARRALSPDSKNGTGAEQEDSPLPLRLRHSLADRCMHWANAALWLLLFITGMGLMHHEALAPFGQAYPLLLRRLAGGGGNLLLVHIILACVWMGCFAVYIALNGKSTLFFLREIFSVRPGDMLWLKRKMPLMILGPKLAARFGLETALPPQGFYNMGQKGFGMLSVLGGVILALSGGIMALGIGSIWLIGWCVTAHYIAAGLVFIGLLAHLYMTLAVPEERPGLRSMFSGLVPEAYAQSHHADWKP
jgi:formate dehydrogenase subunit gamma